MRVVSGELSGRKIEAPPGVDIRPTTDKAREAIFNALGSLNLVRDAIVVDLFAGTGALGLEALSRGAARCIFVERDRTALRFLRGNIDSLGVGERTSVVTGNALVMSRGIEADLVLADPPYGFDDWPALLAGVAAPFVVAEADRRLDPPDGWSKVRERRYGRTWVTFFERTRAEVAVGDESQAESAATQIADSGRVKG